MPKVISNYTERRLQQWAAWALRGRCNAIGYPSRSVEGRLRDEGGVLPRRQGSTVPEVDIEAEQMEKIIVELSHRYFECAEAIKLDYLTIEPQVSKAKKLGVSRMQFIRYRDLGKAWIEGRVRRDVN